MSISPPAATRENLKTAQRADNLALIFQEVLTVIVRLRANLQRVSDVELFRSQLRSAINTAEAEGTHRGGYSIEDVRIGTFAVVAFLDESLTSSLNPVFGDWQRKPMQAEMFGVHLAGDIFYQNLERLLAREDSAPLADLLEVHLLCLLLGFRGRFSTTARSAELQSLIRQLDDKMRAIRDAPATLAWQPPLQEVPLSADRWLPKLRLAAILCGVLSLLLFLFYEASMHSLIGQLTVLASELGK